MSLSNINTINELFNSLKIKINSNNYDSEFGGYSLDIKNDEIKYNLVQLLHHKFWIFDYVHQHKTQKLNGTMFLTRTNFSAFVNKNIVDLFSKELSKYDVIVMIYDHLTLKSHLYANEKKHVFCNQDFITKFKLYFDSFRNPNIKPLEHIYNYGSDIEFLREILKCNLYEILCDNYIQISVINNSFNDTPLLEKCNEILNDICVVQQNEIV